METTKLTPEQEAIIHSYFPDLPERDRIKAAAKKAGIKGLDNPNTIIALARVNLAFDFICQNKDR